MRDIRFEDGDAWMLWTIPEAGTDIEGIIHGYVFCARDAVPSYERLAGCLRRAVHAGLLKFPTGQTFLLEPEWYSKLHDLDASSACTEYGLMTFEDGFLSKTWPVVEHTEFILDKAVYERAAKRVYKYFDDAVKRAFRRSEKRFDVKLWWDRRVLSSWFNTLFKGRKA